MNKVLWNRQTFCFIKRKYSFKCKRFIKLDEPMRQNNKFKPNKTPIKNIKFTLFLYESLFLFKNIVLKFIEVIRIRKVF